ncbi:MAG TPA: PDZ domain-containing protein [Chitinophagaceae bacterium]|nr:PDZ domain-containing protein [Chitinophagaceae bacterium]
MKRLLPLAGFMLINCIATAQIDARLFRYPDVSQTQICFVYGGDVWIVPKAGGTAIRLTSSTGEESYPRFSPDGKTIAFSATYDGNTDVYTMPVAGGVPTRLTWHAANDRVLEWHPDGTKILIASARESGTQAYRQFYLLSAKGGLPEKLPVPYGELASFSPDGGSLTYVTRITENYPFKRYLGGFASDVLTFDLKNKTAENITKSPATEGKPAWHKNRIYYVSDAGANRRRNIWMYDQTKKTKEQLTNFEDADINSMSGGPEELVFEAGGSLHLFNLANNKHSEVKIHVVTDVATLMPRTVNVSNNITNFDLSPDAKRAVFEARGELFSIPAEYGVLINLTNTSGAFERSPSWSPNGKWLAYWSDQSGEYEIYLRETTSGTVKKLTNFGKGMGWQLYWSPDSRKIAFINDRQQINIITVATGEVENIDKTTTLTYAALQGFAVNWSPDSKWLTYSKQGANLYGAIYLYSVEQKKLYQATSGYYNDTRPAFDPTGKYLFFATDRSFAPSYSNLDNTWIYPNSTQLAFATLDPSTRSLLYARNDDVKVIDSSSAEKKPAPPATADTARKPKPAMASGPRVVPENLEARIEILPVPAGNYGRIQPVEGKLIYHRFPNTGSAPGGAAAIYVYDFERREEKVLLSGANAWVISKDGKSMMAREPKGFGIVKLNPDQRIDKVLPTADMEMVLHPREEWRQIFNDTWRRYRDFFYDPSMHQINWNAVGKQYGALVDHAITRWDINTIQQEMISELSAGHTYAGGGDLEQAKNRTHGFLGIDWAVDNNAYRVKRIVRGGKWDIEVRSPMDYSGVNIKEGEYILAVNGRALDTKIDPYAVFEGLSGKAVALKVNDKPTMEGAREVIVKTLTPQEEARLRHLEWIESNRKKVEELSGGKLGYMYMPNTGVQGQTELMRQFYAQIDKEGFVIDERFNAGGQLADRFIEMLNRPVLYNLAWRNADVTVWPVKGNNAPKVMLINGWAGSGGDAFPWAFQQLKLGPIVGERTLGILVGPATGHQLIDGGFITVPDARLYGADGKWFAEGYGIKPEFEVWDDPAQLAKGIDPQLVTAVNEAMKLVKTQPRVLHKRPPYEDRSAKGLKGF